VRRTSFGVLAYFCADGLVPVARRASFLVPGSERVWIWGRLIGSVTRDRHA
jgi:hypothetical protein